VRWRPCVFVVDDDAPVRDSLRWLLESAGLRVHTYADAEEFLDAVRPDWCGCVVADVRLPGLSGLDLQRELGALGIHLPVVLISGHATVTLAVQAMKGGALDFIEKPLGDGRILDSVQRALEEDRRWRSRRNRHVRFALQLAQLSRRERRVLELLAAGKTPRAIAAELGLSEETLGAYRSRIQEKMGVHNEAALIRTLAGLSARGSL